MLFINNTVYNKRSLSALNRLANKTIDPAKKLGQRILCTVMGIAGLAYGYYLQTTTQDSNMMATVALMYGVIFLLIGIFWNAFQNYTSMRMLSKDIKDCHFEFDETNFSCEHALANTNYHYGKICAISQNDDFIALFLDNKHGIVIDKLGFTEGNTEDFITFVEDKTKLTMTTV